METTRKTGLGSSLLLQRTEAPAEPSVSVDVQTPGIPAKWEPSPAEVTRERAAPPQSVSRKKQKGQPLVLRDRCTLYLEREINEQLHLVARIEGRERSDIVTDILRQYLTKYRVERDE